MINVTNDHWYEGYPKCSQACNITWMNDELEESCVVSRKDRERKENQTHAAKINSMKNRRNDLEWWSVRNSMLTIAETKKVYDCIDHASLGKLYTGWGEPEVKSGSDHLPLLNKCRLHECDQDQCLVVRQTCRIPYIMEGREIEGCFDDRPLRERFECVDKVGLSSSNPMSLGFGLAWVIMGVFFGCVSLGMVHRDRTNYAKVSPYQESD